MQQDLYELKAMVNASSLGQEEKDRMLKSLTKASKAYDLAEFKFERTFREKTSMVHFLTQVSKRLDGKKWRTPRSTP